MTTLWNRALSWLPQPRGTERTLDAVVADARTAFIDRRQASSKALASDAAEVALAPVSHRTLATSLGLFAVAAERMLGLVPYDVQFRAAAAMTLGFVAEMQTGEGKTLSVAAAAAALALQNRRVHVATVNQYLADRDYGQFAPVMNALGVSVGVLDDRRSWDEKRRAYACSIVYGTGYAFGFDYLREQLRMLRYRSAKLGERLQRRLSGTDSEAPYQPALDCAIVDELDAVLLDEAGVPLILNEQCATRIDDAEIIAQAAEVARRLESGTHFRIETSPRTLRFTTSGLQFVATAFPHTGAPQLRRPWQQYIEEALTALHFLKRDVDYTIAADRILLVDVPTGRIFEDRRWSEGLHRAVEFREGVPFSAATAGAARITRQRFFRLYHRLTGTSGTLIEARDELEATYGLKLRIVPPRVPSQFTLFPTRTFRDRTARNRAAVAEAMLVRGQGRPVLIGCRSIQVSEEISKLLAAIGIAHQVLNGTQSAEEAQIIRGAGRSGNLLVATNLAGRGTDIRLDEAARRAGGLHIVGIEYHESPRVDRQLLGRAGRQGDPGSGRFFLSADDAIWPSGSGIGDHIRKLAGDDDEVHFDLAAEIRRCRQDVETQSRARRRAVAEHDDWLDDMLRTLARSD